jgi:hypothetical protein
MLKHHRSFQSFRLVAFALAGSFFIGMAPATAQVMDTSAVWRNSVAAFARGKAFEAATMEYLVEELKTDGSVNSYEKGRTTKRADGTTAVIFAEKNGKDTTAENRKRLEAKGGEASAAKPPKGFDATPFDPAWQFALRTLPSGLRGDFVDIPYAIASSDVDISGVARFSKEGIPVSATQRWNRRPPLVSALSSSIEYLSKDEGLFIRRFTIDVSIDALVVKKGLRFAMDYSQWRAVSP